MYFRNVLSGIELRVGKHNGIDAWNNQVIHEQTRSYEAANQIGSQLLLNDLGKCPAFESQNHIGMLFTTTKSCRYGNLLELIC